MFYSSSIRKHVYRNITRGIVTSFIVFATLISPLTPLASLLVAEAAGEPVVSITNPADGAEVEQSNFSLGVNFGDATDCSIVIDGGGPIASGCGVGTSGGLPTLSVGPHSITISGTNTNGTSTDTVNFTIIPDSSGPGNTSPVIDTSSLPAQSGAAVNVSIGVSDNDANTVNVAVEYSLDGGGTWSFANNLSNPSTGSIMGNNIVGITTDGVSSTGVTFNWDFVLEDGMTSSENAMLRFTISDGVGGEGISSTSTFSLTMIAPAGFAGGDGSELDPYQIADCDDIALINATDLSAHYLMINNIDCTSMGNGAWLRKCNRGTGRGFE